MRADRSCPFDGRTAACSSADLNLFDEDQAFLHDQRTLTYTRKASAAVVPPQLECFGWFLLPVADKGRASTTQRWPRLPEAVLARRLHLRLALLQGRT